jgi:large subunit ribosomal protein L30e
MVSVVDEIKSLIKEGKCVIGTEQTIKNLKLGKTSKVFVTSNCPDQVKDDVKYYSELSATEVVELDIPNDELGVICRKPFAISLLSVKKE